MNLPSISIIIPAFNEERLLPGCLESIGRVDYPADRMEIIVVDNGSTDRTVEIAKEAGARVIIDSTQNVAGLRNLGAENATGDILAFVDADCLVKTDWLEKAARYFNDPSVVIWGAPPVPPDPGTWVQQTWFLVRKKAKAIQDVDWLESMNLFIRKADFSKIFGFNAALETCEDVDFCYRASEFGRIISDESIGVVHLGEAATIRHFFRKELWRGKSNFVGVFSHGFNIKELPSFFLPLYFLIGLPLAVLVFALSPGWHSLIVLLLLFALPSAGAFWKLSSRKIRADQWIPLIFLIQIYFIARSMALFRMNNR